MSYPTEIGTRLGSFKNLGDAPVISTLESHAFTPAEDEFHGHDVRHVTVGAKCSGQGCTRPYRQVTHGASGCNCCGSNPSYETALDRAREEANEWAQEHASWCRAMSPA